MIAECRDYYLQVLATQRDLHVVKWGKGETHGSIASRPLDLGLAGLFSEIVSSYSLFAFHLQQHGIMERET
jgi:hypothetical protein